MKNSRFYMPVILIITLLLTLGCSVEERTPLQGDAGAEADADAEGQGSIELHKVDYLWVLDNSGDMCRGQQYRRSQFEDFLTGVVEQNIDFHIAITTTDMSENYPLEPLARPGHFQATPQPLPAFNRHCHHPVDDLAQPILESLQPVVDNIEIAIGCTEAPQDWEHLLEPDDMALRCALNRHRTDVDCSSEFATDMPRLEDFFPAPETYRPIPRVLRSEDYVDAAGNLDSERLSADFSCASFVGTRGYGYRKGLSAAVAAVSPELTGGPGADPEVYPNAGFLREEARLFLGFISNVNDCSHDGTMDESSNCNTLRCTIEENLGAAGALVPVDELRRQFLVNLANSRGLSVDGDATLEELDDLVGNDVIAYSVHAPYQRHRLIDADPYYGEQILERPAEPSDCTGQIGLHHSCNSSRGIGWSGHRYAEFISGFQHFGPNPRYTPREDIDYREIEGRICDDFGDLLLTIP